MDDIYDHLDNYEDLNIVEELKKENHDLKLKLQEYTIAMTKLQKEFDKLSSEFKKLEMNYSSLLKTAKVEIERKTKIITDLNIEKDMIMINILKSRNINDIRKLKSLTNTYPKTPNVPLAENMKGENNNSERKDGTCFSSVDTTSTSGNTNITSKLIQLANKNTESTELWSDRTSDTKENISQTTKCVENHNKPLKTQALSIKNRRKSMPAARSQAKYSSDEECEDRYCSNDDNRKKTREDPNRQTNDKGCVDRHRYKGPEDRNKSSDISNIHDKYHGYPGTSRDSYYRTRNDKHYETEKYGSRNKYDMSLRYRRQSPERQRTSRNNNYHRQEYDRYRVLESPPPDNYYHCQQRNPEIRSKRYRDDGHEFEWRDTNYDKYTSRHKTSSDHYEEPLSKRQRTDSLSKFSDEELRPSRDRPLEKPILNLYQNLDQDLSCQSPDYNGTDADSHTVREIKNTALTPQEDPRIHSGKYILKTSDDKVELTTVNGRNVDLKLFDTSLWDNTQPEVPKSLICRPSQCSEDIVKEIYMDIDNPVSNMSTESGEILSFDVEDNRNELKSSSNDNIQKQEHTTINTEKMSLKNDHKKSLSKYKIPKVKKNELDHNFPASREKCVINKAEQSDIKIKKYQNNKEISDLDYETKTQNVKKLEIPNSKNYDKKRQFADNYSENHREPLSKMKELIAGDLELSDETCDNTEVEKSDVIEKIGSQDQSNINTEAVNKSIVPVHSKAPELQDIKLDKEIEKEAKETIKFDTVLDSNKRSIKKKLSKNKDTSIITKSGPNDKDIDKKTKSKRDSKDPKEIKTKFCELFGDSSSLITPEDLGILAVEAQTQASAPYVPVCEDAQDAVDVTVPDVAKVQTRLSKLKSMETVQQQKVLETSDNATKTVTKSKTHHKNSNDTKKKTKKSLTQVSDKSKIREVYQSLTADKLITEDNKIAPSQEAANEVSKEIVNSPIPYESSDLATAKQPATEVASEPSQVESVNNDSTIVPQEIVDEHTITAQNSEMLPKPNILLRALATSTPQKEPQRENAGAGVEGQAPNCISSKETSYDNVTVATAAESSNNETLNSQNDDVPDVRIFVRRKRRIKTPK